EVWFCCIKAESMGNVRDVDYDFGRIWFGAKATKARESVRAGACACPLANAAYTNMLMHTPTVTGVALEVGLGAVGLRRG
ncbi:MAG: radical SAM protein, partial [Candidatus Eisenbacteria bacterium]|nr:radical SAM protein [Candidatus Eisenbacteria bacterium]